MATASAQVQLDQIQFAQLQLAQAQTVPAPLPAPAESVASAALPGSIGAADLSMIGLFLQADWVVKLVMISLLLASVWCWAIIFEKWLKMRRVAARTDKFENDFWTGGSLDKLYERIGINPDNPMAVLFASAMREWHRSTERGLTRGEGLVGGVQQRIAQVMRVTIDREMDRLERYLGVLATVGSTATFVGLFGTVWGIYHALVNIGMSGQSGLDQVAGPVGEALLMTALGLAVAIPAVLAYNAFTRHNRLLLAEVDGFAHDLFAFMATGIRSDHRLPASGAPALRSA